ncbi:MAG: nuclear transport factor 2 family protein [Thermomicrobiales bacterium]
MTTDVADTRLRLAETLRGIERERLQDLVAFRMEASRHRHAEDFQLINPMGLSLTREDYLGALASGALVYHAFAPVSEIAVRLHGDAAMLRYQSRIDVEVDGQRAPIGTYWHTDLYEWRDGRWQVVWSQATAIIP